MSRIRGKDTTPELQIRALLEASDVVFRQHVRGLPGTPDFVFDQEKVAVFVDGDFWHGWRFPIWQHRMNDFWREKISRTRYRDRKNHRKLRRIGWTVIRIWEHQVETDRLECAQRILDALELTEVNWERLENVNSEIPPLKRRKRLPKP